SSEVEGRFLPPEPPGPEPELGAKRPPPPAQGQQAAYSPPAQPPPGQPPPGPGYPPSGPGWQAPPQQWGYQQAPVPENNPAVAGFVISLVSIGLLVISVGLSSIVSVGCAIAGMVLGRKGVRKVDAGETPRHRTLGQAAFWIGVTSLVLSLLATAGWLIVLVAALTDDEFRDDLEREFDDSESITAVVTALRLASHLLT
ncbi:MAG TPA: hypothetical protein VE270_07165, partial [Thermoleophilaceae bacterium]|nr:hypothetical protein [Thermoleophilaceae bacterium]